MSAAGEKKGIVNFAQLFIGRFDMAKNFAIGGMSGMIATSCVIIDKIEDYYIDSTNGYD